VLVNVEAIHRHAATNGLRPDRLVAPSGETLTSDVCAPLQHALDEEWSNAALDLPRFFSPANGLPLQNQATECIDPNIRRGLPAPEIEQIHAAFWIEPNHHMHGVVATARRDGVVRAAIDEHLLVGRKLIYG